MQRFLFSSLLLVIAGCSSALDVGSNDRPGGGAAQGSGGGPGSTSSGGPDTAQCPAVADATDALVVRETGRFVYGLLVDAGDVYFASTPSTGTGETILKRVAIGGGAATEVARIPQPMSLVMSGEYLFVTPAGNSHYELLRVKKSGGAVESLPLDAGESPVKAIGDGAGGVYYAGLRASASVAPIAHLAADGTRTKLAVDQPASTIVDAMALAGDTLLWAPDAVTATGPADGVVYATASTGGASRTLYGPDPGKPVWAIVVDDTNVYFTRDGGLAKTARAGGPTTTVTGAPPDISELAVSGGKITYVTTGTYDAPSNTMKHARLARVPTAGGKEEILHTELQLPAHVAVGRCAVVWSTNEDGNSSIYRRAD